MPLQTHAPPKQGAQLQSSQPGASPAAQGRVPGAPARPGGCSLHFLSLESRAALAGLDWDNQEGQGASMFLGSASKEDSQLGPRKLGEAWRPPCPREGSKEAATLGTSRGPACSPGVFPSNPGSACTWGWDLFCSWPRKRHCGRVGVGIGAYRGRTIHGEPHPRSSLGRHAGLLTATEAALDPRLALHQPVNKYTVPTVDQALFWALGIWQCTKWPGPPPSLSPDEQITNQINKRHSRLGGDKPGWG